MSSVIVSTPVSPGSWTPLMRIEAQLSMAPITVFVLPVTFASMDMASMPHDPGSGGVGGGSTHR
jgi:hypothetical protein